VQLSFHFLKKVLKQGVGDQKKMATHPPKKGNYTFKDLKGEDFSIETRSKKN
jgi:hypothetical protein